MSQQMMNIEGFFKQTLSAGEVQPSASVLRKLRFKLWVQDFFSLRFRKFNVVYATAIIAAGVFIVVPSYSERGEVNIAENTGSEAIIPEASSVEEKLIPPEKEQLHIATPTEKQKAAAAPEPIAGYEPSAKKGCAPMQVNFLNKSQYADKYKWNFGDGNTSELSNPLYTYKKPGKYTATLEVTSAEGKVKTFDREIIVYEKPNANFDIDIEASEIAGRTIYFKNKSENGQQYKWQFGDAGSSDEAEPAHTFPEHASYKVQLIVKNEKGCADTAATITHFIEENYELAFPITFKPSTLSRGNNGYYEHAQSGSSIFYPENYGAEEYTLTVWAPNGMKVFGTTDINQGWNGYIRGRIAPGGIYTYEAKGIYPNGKAFKIKNKFKVLVNRGVDDYGY